jgi:DDE superfamily endonuclease
MDESGFAVGSSQSSRALVNIRENNSWKVISGRQEWITAIECVNAAGAAIPPMIIFKAKYTNSGWIPPATPSNWRFTTSNSGWTSDSHGFEWLSTVFDPMTKPEEPKQRRLLILDGHSSHMTANFIAFCMDNAIDLLILPPHCTHVLQPLDISLFSPLKRALAVETDAVAELDHGRIPRVEWTEMYIRARGNAFTAGNINSGWRKSGLVPLEPMKVIETLPVRTESNDERPHTPTRTADLNLSLLDSSPPDGTELREANQLFNSSLQSVEGLPEATRRYGERMTQAYELTHSELIAARRQNSKLQELLHKRKERKKGKRIAVKGKFVFTTQEVLDIVQKVEAETAAKKAKKKPAKRVSDEIPDEEMEDVLERDSDT